MLSRNRKGVGPVRIVHYGKAFTDARLFHPGFPPLPEQTLCNAGNGELTREDTGFKLCLPAGFIDADNIVLRDGEVTVAALFVDQDTGGKMPAAVSAEADSQIFSGVVAPIVFAKAASLLFCDAFIGVCAVAEQNAIETQLLRRAQPLQGCVADGIRQVRAILRAAPGTGARRCCS